MRFEDLELIEPIMKALKDKGYTEPTPIQEKSIPLVLNRHDILGCAQTGTGKTAAFSLPIIQLLHLIEGKSNGKPTLRSLIVTPTRELAIQIDENIKEYSKYTQLKHTVIFGGVKQHSQVEKLKRGVHVLVATPGRLLDLISQGFIKLDTIKVFVLDEADRMLDMGFINDIKKLLKLLPEERQSLFFSATMPQNIVKLADNILTKPKKVEVTPASSTAETIQQYLYYTNRTSKKDLLIHIIEKYEMEQVLVFSRTKHGADRIVRHLKKSNITSAAIHGDKAQPQRQKALKAFKSGAIKVLVATDIAARGIDIEKLKHVVNFDVPNVAETYVHRIGRSGRAGEEGMAISICEPEENAFVKDINKLIGKDKIQVVSDSPFPQTEKPMTEAEKKEWNKEKQRRKQEFFANRKAGRGGAPKRKDKKENRSSDKPKRKKPQSNSGAKVGTGAKQEVTAKSTKPHENSRNKAGKKNKNQPKGKNTSKEKKPFGPRKHKSMPSSLKSKYMWPLE